MRKGRQWKTPPAKVPTPVMAPRASGRPRPASSPVSESPCEKAMLTPAPRAVARPVKKAVSGWWVATTTAKIGASVHEPAHRRLHALQQEAPVVSRRGRPDAPHEPQDVPARTGIGSPPSL